MAPSYYETDNPEQNIRIHYFRASENCIMFLFGFLTDGGDSFRIDYKVQAKLLYVQVLLLLIETI